VVFVNGPTWLLSIPNKMKVSLNWGQGQVVSMNELPTYFDGWLARQVGSNFY